MEKWKQTERNNWPNYVSVSLTCYFFQWLTNDIHLSEKSHFETIAKYFSHFRRLEGHIYITITTITQENGSNFEFFLITFSSTLTQHWLNADLNIMTLKSVLIHFYSNIVCLQRENAKKKKKKKKTANLSRWIAMVMEFWPFKFQIRVKGPSALSVKTVLSWGFTTGSALYMTVISQL